MNEAAIELSLKSAFISSSCYMTIIWFSFAFCNGICP